MELRVAADDLGKLHQELLSVAPAEGGAFLAVEPAGSDLVLRSCRVFQAEETDVGAGAPFAISDEAKVSALAEIKRGGHAAVEVHTHPGADRQVTFSRFDEDELPSFARYVQLKIPNRPFGALVFGRRAYEGRVYDGNGAAGTLGLRAVGERRAIPPWFEPTDQGSDSSTDDAEARFDRQIRALGSSGQRILEHLTVGVVGLGGTGSQVVQQLAHLGVSRFVLIDDDRIDSTNLHRLVGARRRDVWLRRRKSAIATRLIRGLSHHREIATLGNLRALDALDALKTVDLMFGCVDNDGARLVMSELAAAYLIPYLDLGVGIEQAGQRAIGGRVAFFLPGGPCLACADELDFAEAAEDLASSAEREVRRARGYARERQIEAALIPLNTAVVGTGMFEFLAFATGVDRVIPFQRYDALARRLTRTNVTRDGQCPVCEPARGMGDRHRIERYTRLSG